MSDLQDAQRKARMAIREDTLYSVATKASLTEAVGRVESIAALVELCAANAVEWAEKLEIEVLAALTPGDTDVAVDTVRSALEGDPGAMADGFRLAADLLDDSPGDTK